MTLAGLNLGPAAWNSSALTIELQSPYMNNMKNLNLSEFCLTLYARAIPKSFLKFPCQLSRAFRIQGCFFWGRPFRKFRFQGGV